MVAIRGPKKAKGSEADSAEESPCAVATITRLIHDLYASDGCYAAIREGRDSALIKWSEVIGAVRGR